MPSPPATPRPHPDIVSRSIGGEMVLVPVRGERGDLETLYRLDAVGAFIWKRLAGGAEVDEVVADLVDGWEVDAETARADLGRFLGELREAGLLAEEAGA